MKKHFLYLVIFSALAASAGFHYWEYRKIQEFSNTFHLQSEIEVKRIALMVLYQEILQNVTREVDHLRQGKIEKESAELSHFFDSFPVQKENIEVQP